MTSKINIALLVLLGCSLLIQDVQGANLRGKAQAAKGWDWEEEEEEGTYDEETEADEGPEADDTLKEEEVDEQQVWKDLAAQRAETGFSSKDVYNLDCLGKKLIPQLEVGLSAVSDDLKERSKGAIAK